jgi:replicative superfamily II helicase
MVACKSPVVYMQLDPGNGKTFVNLLALTALCKLDNLNILYLTPFEYLVDDVNEKVKLFDDLKIKVM